MKMEHTQHSKMLAFKLQKPVNHPEDSIQHSERSESLKYRITHKVFVSSLLSIAVKLFGYGSQYDGICLENSLMCDMIC
jgi:hypothetical protein